MVSLKIVTNPHRPIWFKNGNNRCSPIRTFTLFQHPLFHLALKFILYYLSLWVRGSNNDTKVNTRTHEVGHVIGKVLYCWYPDRRVSSCFIRSMRTGPRDWRARGHREITSSFSQVFFKFPKCFGKPFASVFFFSCYGFLMDMCDDRL